ncbi:BglG family transcription antiterminator [Lactococcus fujiensis]|uniref:Ascorbate-specific PTS system EIIA component n=1 Tax=Lactococcus fujiensis JCM 16395 TaxID=1291764 RepID=A0A2A5RQ37_9LACT|nr:PTS sugar transporter subunit IIA [Lactococcus fujiensis]PCS01542.1 transcriptional antiterminator [Lactococcus fujiensis JCM 16395]
MISYDLDELFYSKKRFWKIEMITELTGLNKKEVNTLVSQFNEQLIRANEKSIEDNHQVIAFPESLSRLEEIRFGILKPKQVTIEKSERQRLIFLFIFLELGSVSISTFKESLNTSKNTILTDLKQVRQNLKDTGIEILYHQTRGFYLVGEEWRIRRFAYQEVQNLTDNYSFYSLSKVLNSQNQLFMAQNSCQLKNLIGLNHLNIVYSRFRALQFYTGMMAVRQKDHSIEDRFPQLVKNFQFGSCQITALSERNNLIALLIGASDGIYEDDQLDFLYRIAFQIMENVMKLTAMEFDDFSKTFDALLAHLYPAYFRLIYHLETSNHLLTRIRQEYSDLFNLIEKALSPLTDLTGPISQEELGYFVILFGGEIYKKRHQRALQAIVLCANGISSSLIMKKRLSELFPNMEFVVATSIAQLDEIPVHSYDVIFSTLQVESSKKVYLFSPFPKEDEIRQLYNQIVHDFELPSLPLFSEEQLFQLLKPLLREDVSFEDIKKVLQRKIKLNKREEEKESLMLQDLIKGKNIQFTERELNWEDAITLAAQPLLDSNSIEPSYITAMINRIKEFGPFVDLGMGIALPHARPEDGVNKVGMTFLRCEKPVKLLDDVDHEIKIFIVLSAIDNEAHLRALSSLTQILSNREELQKLLDATTINEVEHILSEKGETK